MNSGKAFNKFSFVLFLSAVVLHIYTYKFLKVKKLRKILISAVYLLFACIVSRVAQWKRAGPITQRSEDQNLALLLFYFFFVCVEKIHWNLLQTPYQ